MSKNLFHNMPYTRGQHFSLFFYAAVLHLLEHVALTFDSWDEVFKQFPFLASYHQEIGRHGLDKVKLDDAASCWRASLEEWERETDLHLPLRALRVAADLDYDALTLWMCVGLVEEDARFGTIFESLQGIPGGQRPTLGFINECWQRCSLNVRRAFRRLQELGLVQVTNPEAPRAQWALQVSSLLWDALREETLDAPVAWARYSEPSRLKSREELTLPAELQANLKTVPSLLTHGEAQTLVVRGPQHNGRRTTVGAIARAMQRGVIELSPAVVSETALWRTSCVLATMLNAVPVLVLDLAPGETAQVPRVEGYTGPLAIVLGKHGGLTGEGVERALSISLEMPGAEARRELWQRSFGQRAFTDEEEVSGRFRLTSGNITRAADLAATCAAVDARATVSIADVQQATRALHRQELDTLATRIDTRGDWNHLALKSETMRELSVLESRCRHRERLRARVGECLSGQVNCGVRALFSGPSGTGKTLAAKMLAAVLSMDLYRVDLSSVVNKYIGETEKNLNRIFARAEELDVMLLLDEGDALLTQRTGVQTANDRYANLETNYLLQRLETFEGIIVVTTNASDRIDTAFQRRMDVVVNFQLPDTSERAQIWQMHLPQAHGVERFALDEITRRCALNGGQIRNAVLHAALLAMNEQGHITARHLEEAVQREYRKSGTVCPLRTFQ